MERTHLTVEDWLKGIDDGTKLSSDDVMLVKATADVQIEEVKAADGKDGHRFTISNSNEDRDRDVIEAKGWQLKNYRKNPVVLFAHSYRDLPIGRSTETKIDGDALKSTVHYTPDEAYAAGQPGIRGSTIREFIRGKFLNAASVGFWPITWERREEEEEKSKADMRRLGVKFIKTELLEWSVVPVPAHPEALVEARSKMDSSLMAEYVKWCEKVLDEWTDYDGLLITRATLEEARSKAKGEPLILSLLGIEPEAEVATDNGTSNGGAAGEVKVVEPVEPKEVIPVDPNDLPKKEDVLEPADPKQIDLEEIIEVKVAPLVVEDWDGVKAAMAGLLGDEDAELPELAAEQREALYSALCSWYRAYGIEAPEYRHIEAQVLKTLPELFTFDSETGKLECTAFVLAFDEEAEAEVLQIEGLGDLDQLKEVIVELSQPLRDEFTAKTGRLA